MVGMSGVAIAAGKPLVVEEFGLAREGEQATPRDTAERRPT